MRAMLEIEVVGTTPVHTLTERQKDMVWAWMLQNQRVEDSHPDYVLQDRYHGDRDAYLREMAGYLLARGIEIPEDEAPSGAD